MKRNLGLKLIETIVILSIMLSVVGYSYAATNKELENKKSNIENKIDETKKQANEVKEQKQDTQKEVKDIAIQISDYEKKIKDLDAEISKLESSTKEMQTKIDELQQTYDKNKALLEERLVALYEAGNTSFLDFILGSEDLTDFISKYTLAEEITSYDQELIAKVEKESEELKNLKNDLNLKLEKIETKKDSRSSVVKQLAVAKGQKEEEVEKLGHKQEELEHDIAQFEKEAKALDSQIEANNKALQKKYEEAKRKAEENKKNNSNSSNSSNSEGSSSNSNLTGGGQTSSKGFIRPINSSCPISAGWYYPSGGFHGAVDFSTNKKIGVPIYAVADGIVITSTWGGADSYGNYVLIRHFNGLYTLYAHGSSLVVSKGAEVKQGQVIMYSGNTGNSSGPHLHFEVRTEPGKYDNRVSPMAYLP